MTSCSPGIPGRGARGPHVSTPARSGDPLGQGTGHRRHRRGDPHHLAPTTDLVSGYDPVYKVNPRCARRFTLVLREALADGTIDAVATDHAPHALNDKQHAFVDAAFGMLGLETAFAVVHDLMVATGQMSMERLAEVMSVAPARIAGLSKRHGRPIAVREPATLALVDPSARWTVDREESASLSRNNPGTAARMPAGLSPRCCRAGSPPATAWSSARGAGGGRAWAGGPGSRGWADLYRFVIRDGGETFGEAVFATGMTGYQETLTDPSPTGRSSS